MIMMAQHPQQQQHQAHSAGADQQHQQASGYRELSTQMKQQASTNITETSIPIKSENECIQKQAINMDQSSARLQEVQEGKRSIIKNQLYLIEQLQLENANLRNERDQLQLENEELKFQLQMISSSNILNQPGTALNGRQLEKFVSDNAKTTTSTTDMRASSQSSHGNDKAKLTTNTPLRYPTRQRADLSQGLQRMGAVRCSASVLDCDKIGLASSATSSHSPSNSNKFLNGKSASLAAFNIKANLVPFLNRADFAQDEDEQRIKLVEQRYGDSEQVQAAAIVIQRAFRKYQICKRFRTITEQLRHTCQANQTTNGQCNTQVINGGNNAKAAAQNENVTFVSGATRAAAWESLSYAASRLAASAAAATAGTKQALVNGVTKSVSSQQVALNSMLNTNNKPPSVQNVVQHLQHATARVQSFVQDQHRSAQKQDSYVAAAINFQQLESIRKRQYRVGLNIFNKNPEKDSSKQSNQMLQQQNISPIQSCQMCYEEDNLKRNVAHFLLHRKGLAREKIGQYLGNLQAQFNQDVLKYYLQELDFYGLQIDIALRKFSSTLRLPGEAQKIERIIDCFAQRYVQCQQQQANSNLLRNNVSANNLQAQTPTTRLENLSETPTHAPSYKNNLLLMSKDEIFILTFAIIMLNTDLHSPSLKTTSRMSASQFINNLRGVFKSQTIQESDLLEIYERVKTNQISTTPDHVTHVLKVQQGLTVSNFQKKELPNLPVPHRRLVCFCRLFEVYDVNKKERIGQHQREIFLFNDMLLVTKLARRARTSTTQQYVYRQSIPLKGLYVQLFQSTYYSYGLKLCHRSNDEAIIMFNARNELDQSRFVDDLSESIAEMDEMESMREHNVVETIHFKQLERLKRHAMMHNPIDNLKSASINNQNTGEDNINFDSNRDECEITDSKPSNKSERLLTAEDRNSIDSSVRVRSSKHAHRVQSKFNSMSNLSVVAEGKDDSNDSNEGLKHNRSFVHQPQQATAENRSSSSSNNRNEPIGGAQRSCSSGSVHSLDSGLFLSRDVSPNQSS